MGPLRGRSAPLAFALAARARRARAARPLLAPAGVLALTLVAVLAVPLSADMTAIDSHVTDAGYVGALPSEEQRLISDYLRAHQGSARYEVAALSATQIGSLIVQDARPVLVLTTYGGRVFTTVPKLKPLIAEGKVRYAFLNSAAARQRRARTPRARRPRSGSARTAPTSRAQAGLRRAGPSGCCRGHP